MKAILKGFWPVVIILILGVLSFGRGTPRENELADHQLDDISGVALLPILPTR